MLSFIVRTLVDFPDEVNVVAQASERGVAFIVQIAPADAGQVIGKQGRTIRSIRTIALACGQRIHQRVSVDVEARG